MSFCSDGVDHDGDGKVDQGESNYEGKEDEFAEDLAAGKGIGGKVHIMEGIRQMKEYGGHHSTYSP